MRIYADTDIGMVLIHKADPTKHDVIKYAVVKLKKK